MKKTLFLGATVALMFVQCGKDQDKDPFKISDGRIGNITENTKIKQLDSIFSMDSIVKTSGSPNQIETQGEVEVYEKGGQRLLLLSPEDELSPNSTITDILVYDPRYKTDNGLSVSSTYKDFRETYTVSRVDRLLNGVLVFFSDSDIYLTIDAKYLTGEVRNDRDAKLESHHIIDSAPIKYLRINWNPKN